MRGCMDEFVVSALAASGRREMLALDARHLEAGAAVAFLHNLVDARRLNFLAGLVLVCHSRLLVVVPVALKQNIFRGAYEFLWSKRYALKWRMALVASPSSSWMRAALK